MSGNTADNFPQNLLIDDFVPGCNQPSKNTEVRN